MESIGFIGGGNMAEALLKGILQAGLVLPQEVWVSDVRADRLEILQKQYGVQVTGDNRRLTSQAKVVILSVKPQTMKDVLEEIAGSLKEDAMVISMAAGIPTGFIRGKLGNVPVVRVMPNTPALIGAGASALTAAGTSDEAVQTAVQIFSSVGKTVVLEEESALDAVTAVSGSGPAYFFLMMETMIHAARELGLSREVAETLVLQTAKGAALLAEAGREKGESPEQLRKKVTSPGGTTEAALKVFAARGFDSLVKQALAAAFDRSRQLSRIS